MAVATNCGCPCHLSRHWQDVHGADTCRGCGHAPQQGRWLATRDGPLVWRPYPQQKVR